MKIKSAKLVYFSPTGTTKSIAKAIGKSMDNIEIEYIDITLPASRTKPLKSSENELLIVAVPVYSGRVPILVSKWLEKIQSENTLAVAVVVYGNREFDDALLELKDILTSQGCKPIGGAAFIGEHSFSSDELPASVGRPDDSDLKLAKSFGEKLLDKLQSIDSVESIPDVLLPGNYPYKKFSKRVSIDFIDVNDDCTQCGICAMRCPVGVIDSQNSRMVDFDNCIRCCACIKGCPENAKSMKPGPMKDIAKRIHENFNVPKAPVFFL